MIKQKAMMLETAIKHSEAMINTLRKAGVHHEAIIATLAVCLADEILACNEDRNVRYRTTIMVVQMLKALVIDRKEDIDLH